MKVFLALVIGLLLGVFVTLMRSPTHPWCDRCRAANLQLDTFKVALNAYRSEQGSFPSASEGLNELLVGEYLRRIPNDPWGNEFHYRAYSLEGNECYVIWSYGSDEELGGAEEYSADFVRFSDKDCLIGLK